LPIFSGILKTETKEDKKNLVFQIISKNTLSNATPNKM
jgi:hypothetical protein